MVESANDENSLRSGKNESAVPVVPSPSSSPPNGASDENIIESLETSREKHLGDISEESEATTKPSPSRTAVEALYKRLPRFYKGHKEQTTHWDHPLLTKIFEEDIASYNDVRYAAYRTALKFRTICNKLQLHQIKLSTIRAVLKQHGYEAVYQNNILIPCVELETLMADIYLSARREVPTIDQPELNAELLLCLLLKLYDTNRCGTIKLISAKIGLALLSSGTYLDKWKYILSELYDYNRCLSRKNAFNLLYDVARIPEILGEKRLFGTHLVTAAVESLWIRGRVTAAGLPEDGFRHWLKDEPQTLVWLSTSYRIRQAERLRHHIKCSVCRTQPITGLRYRCLRCYNYNMCQNCFFTGKSNKTHRLRHPIREYCSYVTAGQETKDLIKIMKNRVFRGEDYEPKPRYMPILPDSVSAIELNADFEADDNRSRSTAPSHGNSTGTPSGSVSAVNKKDFEVDVEVISELDSAHGGGPSERSLNNIPRSISEPVDGKTRFAYNQPSFEENPIPENVEFLQPVEIIVKPPDNPPVVEVEFTKSVEVEVRKSVEVEVRKSVEVEVPKPVEVEIPKNRPKVEVEIPKPPIKIEVEIPKVSPKMGAVQTKEATLTPNQTKRQISAVTAQILNYAEVDVVVPKLQNPVVNGRDRVNYTKVNIGQPPPLISAKTWLENGKGKMDAGEFSALDYIDASPRGELPVRYDHVQSSMWKGARNGMNGVNKSSVEIQTDVAERENGFTAKAKLDEIRRQVNAMKRENREIHDQFDAMHRLVESSSPSPDLLIERRQIENAIQSRNAVFESQLNQLEKMLVENLGPISSSQNGHIIQEKPVPPRKPEKIISVPGSYSRYPARSESFNDSLYQSVDARLPPFPVDKNPKAISDPNTPLKRNQGPPPPQRMNGIAPPPTPPERTNGVAYHPILDELEEKLRSLNTPLTPRDLKHPFWHHLKEKFETVLGQSGTRSATVTYQSYGKIDKDYAHTPGNYGRNIAHNSHLDVSDSLVPGLAHPSPNESQSSGFSSGRETDMKWEEDVYQGPPGFSRTFGVSQSYRIPRSKSMGIAAHRHVSDDIAQLDKLLEWLDEFKKST